MKLATSRDGKETMAGIVASVSACSALIGALIAFIVNHMGQGV